jgi:hypothetical protein
VVLEDVGGSVDVDNQNGAVEVSGVNIYAPGTRQCNQFTVRTTFSTIRFALPDNAGVTVNARTSNARVNSELPLTVSGEIRPDTLTGKIGDGACAVNLTNSNGSISIQRARGKP